MNCHRGELDDRGFLVLPDVLTSHESDKLAELCDAHFNVGPGQRDFLQFPWVQELAQRMRQHPIVSPLLPDTSRAVQCTYFRKTPSTNWLVPLHRDTSIPVSRRFDLPGWSGWSVKNGTQYAKPPSDLLQELLAIRLHFEANHEQNGALNVVPTSHRSAETREPRIPCQVPKGGALLMRPLLLHSSSKLLTGNRRVLHFLYGPAQLPQPMEWAHAV